MSVPAVMTNSRPAVKVLMIKKRTKFIDFFCKIYARIRSLNLFKMLKRLKRFNIF